MIGRLERRTLRDSPLALVLTEVRFSPVLKMDSHVPDIQEIFRKNGFPGFQHAVGQELSFADDGPKLTASARWVFIGKKSQDFIILTNSSVAYQTTEYANFEDFIKVVQLALDTIHRCVDLSLVQRIGLRYFNVVEPQDDQDLSYYLRPSMRALSADEIGATKLLWHVENLAETPVGVIKVLLSQKQGAPLLPPELMTPELAHLANPQSDVTTTLDIDGSAMETVEFDLDDVLTKLWDLHSYTDKAFVAAVTGDALSAWGEEYGPAE